MRLTALLCPITALAAPSAMRLTLVVAAILGVAACGSAPGPARPNEPTSTAPASQTAPIRIGTQQYTMDLEPHSVRAPGYQMLAQQADGTLVSVDPGPLRTLQGSLTEVPGSHMAASLLDDGLHGSVVMPDGTRWWFEPIVGRVPGAAANEYATNIQIAELNQNLQKAIESENKGDVIKVAQQSEKKAELMGKRAAKKTMLAKQVLQEINAGGRVSKKTQLAMDDAASDAMEAPM